MIGMGGDSMVGAVIFVIFFLVFLAITLGVPTLPPGSMIHELLGIPETGWLVLGIPGWLLINAIVNGVVFGFIIWLIYSLVSKSMGRGKKPTPTIQQTVSVQVQEKAVEAREEPVATPREETAKSLSMIEGIGPAYARQLSDAGIKSSDDLLEAGSTKKKREDLAEKTGIAEKLILEWTNLADLFRIKGVGEEYSDLLEEAGVDTVVELSRRNPENLHAKICEVNDEKELVRRPPSLNQVTGWIEQAKKLPRKIHY
jgi:predicted flap endonuclease-1-like 5' DNA nuclease